MAQGWIKLHRKIKDSYLWQDKEPFDKRSAWIDLLLTANHCDNKTLINSQLILVKRGEFITSEVKLAEKWKWDRGKVRRFLKLLESDNMIIKTPTARLYITIQIVNYSGHQDNTSNATSETVENTGLEGFDKQVTPQETNKSRTSNEQVTNINKNDKECIKNDKKIINLSAEQTPYEEIKDLFNKICITLPRIKAITKSRQTTVKARWRENPNMDFFKDLFEIVNSSSFLRGDEKWKNCCFDWIMTPSNMQKILEGNYANKKTVNSEDWMVK